MRRVGSAGRDAALAALVGIATLAMLYPYVYPDYPSLWGPLRYSNDEGTTLLNAKRMLDGVAHRDFFEFKGPGGLLPFTLAFRLDRPSVASARLAMFLVLALGAAATYLVAARSTGRRLPGLLAGLSVSLLAWPNWPFAYQQWSAVTYLALAALCALRAWERAAPAALAWAGLACGAAFWSDIAQSLPATVALAAAVGLAWAADRRPRPWATAIWFGAGFAAVALAVAAAFWWPGALGGLIEEMFVYPFSHYRDANYIAYGAGGDLRRWLWVEEAAPLRAAVRLLCELPLLVLPLAVGLALLVGGLLLAALLADRFAGRPLPPPRRQALARAAIPAALAASALPLLLNVSRRDLSHMAFVVPAALLALACVLGARIDGGGPAGRALRIGQATGLALIGAALLVSAVFHARNHWQTEARFRAIDAVVRSECQVEFVERATAPRDTALILPGSGYHFLLGSRTPAVPFTVMFRDRSATPWAHWQRAAAALAERPASVLLISQVELEDLLRFQPALAARYFGEPGLYLLDQRRPGPPLPAESTWRYEIVADDGTRRVGTWRLRNPDGGARLEAVEGGGADGATMVGRVDGDRLVLLPPGAKLAARLSADGRSFEGIVGPRLDCRVLQRSRPSRVAARRIDPP